MHMCLVDMEKAFDRVPRKVVERATRKKDLLEIMVREVMSLYNGAKGGICIFREIQSKS